MDVHFTRTALAGRPIRRSESAQISWLYSPRARSAGVGHRLDHGHVHSALLRGHPAPAVCRSRQTRDVVGKAAKTERQNVVSIVNFKTWKERARSFDSMAAYNQGPKNLLGGDEPVQITGANVTADFFRVLRVEPILGRAFAPDEDGPAGAPLAVLSHGFWQRRFGGQASVIGQRISISGTHHEIIGVLPQDFSFPNRRIDLFTSLRAEYSGRDFNVVARLRSGCRIGRRASGDAEHRRCDGSGKSRIECRVTARL